MRTPAEKKEAARVASLKWYHNHKNEPGRKEKHVARALAWQKANPEKKLAINRKSRYGITAETYETLVKEQNGKCAICKTEAIYAVDHCHTSGEIRGLLCLKCNLMIGYAKDNPELLRAGAEYLEDK